MKECDFQIISMISVYRAMHVLHMHYGETDDHCGWSLPTKKTSSVVAGKLAISALATSTRLGYGPGCHAVSLEIHSHMLNST